MASFLNTKQSWIVQSACFTWILDLQLAMPSFLNTKQSWILQPACVWSFWTYNQQGFLSWTLNSPGSYSQHAYGHFGLTIGKGFFLEHLGVLDRTSCLFKFILDKWSVMALFQHFGVLERTVSNSYQLRNTWNRFVKFWHFLVGSIYGKNLGLQIWCSFLPRILWALIGDLQLNSRPKRWQNRWLLVKSFLQICHFLVEFVEFQSL